MLKIFINVNSADVECILVSNKDYFGKKSFIYFVGCKNHDADDDYDDDDDDDDDVTPLLNRYPKLNIYEKC